MSSRRPLSGSSTADLQQLCALKTSQGRINSLKGQIPILATMNIADLRKSYEKAELSESASNADPLLQFSKWLEEAISSEVPEPNAMTVATVGSNLRPSTRVVLIKGYDERGIVWYTNYDSRKGQELAGNPFAAL
eukprot:gene8725-11810_t